MDQHRNKRLSRASFHKIEEPPGMIGIGKSLGKIRKKIVPSHLAWRQMAREGIGVIVERWSV